MPKQKNDDPYRTTLAAVAEWFGMSRTTLEEWNQTSDAPKKTARGYNLRQWAVWLAKRRRGSMLPKDSPDLAIKHLKRETLQFDLDVKKGRYVRREEYDLIQASLAQLFVGEIERAPIDFSLILAGKSPAQIRALTEDWIDKMRMRIVEKMDDGLETNHVNEDGKAISANPAGSPERTHGRSSQAAHSGRNGSVPVTSRPSHDRQVRIVDQEDDSGAGYESREGMRAFG